MILVCLALILSPIGAVLDADARTHTLWAGLQIRQPVVLRILYICPGAGLWPVPSPWHTERRNFLLGLLVFAAFGYVETAVELPQALRTTTVTLSNENDFLFSSIPYALYGIFLIFYFLRHPVPAPLEMGDLSETFRTRYGITDREREIILKVIQGKSNADIAGELFISLATVKTHLHNIYRKIESRAAMTCSPGSGPANTPERVSFRGKSDISIQSCRRKLSKYIQRSIFNSHRLRDDGRIWNS